MMKADIKKTLQASLVLIAGVFLLACSNDANTLHTISGIQVPPDPGAAGKTTLAGIDSNNNGVRDDVERFIAGEYGSNKEQYDRAMSYAKKSNLLYSKDHAVDLESITNRFPNSNEPSVYLDHITCAVRDNLYNNISSNYIDEIDKLYLNTKERSARYGHLFGGMARDTSGAKCD